MRNENYKKLSSFLSDCNREQFLSAFAERWLNEIVPGTSAMLNCSQGTKNHLEGDVAVHTSFVFENLTLVAQRRLGRGPDFIEQVSVLVHDICKPQCSVEDGEGGVTFPGHEQAAALRVAEVANNLSLTEGESTRLRFIVAHHGDAHDWLDISSELRSSLSSSPYFESLALIQEADALSCIRLDQSCLPVHWEQMLGIAPRAD